MKLSNIVVIVDDDVVDQEGDTSPKDQDQDRGSRKSVKFAMDRSVRFGNDEETIE